MNEEEKKVWVDAIIELCVIQHMGSDSVYDHLRSILLNGKPILDDAPISAWIVDSLDDKYHKKYCPLVQRTKKTWRCWMCNPGSGLYGKRV